MASRTCYHLRMPCQALCKKEHALRACGLGSGWSMGFASPPPHWRLTLRADAARLANRPYHFAAQSALNGAVGRFPPPGPPPLPLLTQRFPRRGVCGARGRGSPLGFHAHDTGTEAAPSPHAIKSNPILHPRQKSPPRRRALCGWSMGFEPMTTGTTIRGSTAELTPPLQRKVAGRV